MTKSKSRNSNARRDDGPHLGQDIDLRSDVVPLVRSWLEKGISLANLRSSVRVRDARKLAGGLKSPVVADLAIEVRAIVKQGSAELVAHERLMRLVNEHCSGVVISVNGRRIKVQSAVFPEVMGLIKLPDASIESDHLLMQQSLVNYTSVHEQLYAGRVAQQRLQRTVESGAAALQAMHTLKCSTFIKRCPLPETHDPFTTRLRDRMNRLEQVEPWLATARTRGAVVDGLQVKPLNDIIERARQFQCDRSKRIEAVVVHGDPHIGNLMMHSRGKNQSVRWIDPNPTVGYSDPAYDWGKLMHFVDTVGWAKHNARLVSSIVGRGRGKLRLATRLRKVQDDRERTRQRLEHHVRSLALAALKDDAAAFELAIASAHVGLAGLDAQPGAAASSPEARRRRFALIRTIAALARCDRYLGKVI